MTPLSEPSPALHNPRSPHSNAHKTVHLVSRARVHGPRKKVLSTWKTEEWTWPATWREEWEVVLRGGGVGRGGWCGEEWGRMERGDEEWEGVVWAKRVEGGDQGACVGLLGIKKWIDSWGVRWWVDRPGDRGYICIWWLA